MCWNGDPGESGSGKLSQGEGLGSEWVIESGSDVSPPAREEVTWREAGEGNTQSSGGKLGLEELGWSHGEQEVDPGWGWDKQGRVSTETEVRYSTRQVEALKSKCHTTNV